MRKKPKGPFIPPQRNETVRQSIITLLEGQSLSAKEISADVRVSEKDVYEHLEHIQKKKTVSLAVSPAECKKCGYQFANRERLRKPGRCPECKGESIQEPLFSIRKK
ncbi:MAG: transcriptional regulator containing an domain fused to a Zn-ribbon-like protein [Nitrospirae bacterium]|nr:transcriptional regulator containing an domain fused to a Zn-ribbon-like protein [Nitrospirota bacterium]